MRHNTHHPDETALDPYTPRELQQEPETQYKRDLYMVAKRLRTTEAQLKEYLSQLNIAPSDDLLSVTISRNQAMIRSPRKLPTVRRAKTAQTNLRSIYQQWAELCEKHRSVANTQS